MILCIDIGNTNIKYGLFEGDELRISFRVATDLKRTSDQYGTAIIDMFAVKGISPAAVHGAIISSVVPSSTCARVTSASSRSWSAPG